MEKVQCPACRGPVPQGARFCATCGSPVAEFPGGDAMLDALQRSLEGRYRLLRLLGRGGMGAVYLARELSLDRLVAIKVLHQDRALPAQARERFRREARTVARLTHPNIVPLHGVGAVDGVPYLVMGYVAGESLDSRLQREGRLSLDQAMRILADVADALDYAHRQEVVHRDVKPANVLLDAESGRALLGDFGLAKAAGFDSTMSSGHVLGTPHYMSPEQASGGTADRRSDVYSLGVMAYRMLSGRLPFHSADVRELLVKQIREAPAPLEDIAPGLPGPLVTAVHRCLAKNPVQRWPDARSFRRAITGDWGAAAGAATARLQGQGLLVAAGAAACVAVAALPFRLSAIGSDRFHEIAWDAIALASSVALVALFVYGFGVARALQRSREVGFTWKEVFTTLFRQPRWWTGPYPRRLRWPGDVWARLPRRVKFFRCVAQLPALILIFGTAFTVLAARPSAAPGTDIVIGTASFLAVWLALTASVIALAAVGRGAMALSWVPTMDAEAWRDPALARWLRPQGGVTPASAVTEPAQHLEAIAGLAEEVSGVARAAAEEAVFMARRIVAALASLEREAADMARHAEPAEVQRLETRLAILGPESQGENTETAELRRLLTRQLDLLRPMEDRVEAARVRRQRLRELLGGLHQAIGGLRDALGKEPDAWREPGHRLHELCREAAALTGDTPAGEALTTSTW